MSEAAKRSSAAEYFRDDASRTSSSTSGKSLIWVSKSRTGGVLRWRMVVFRASARAAGWYRIWSTTETGVTTGIVETMRSAVYVPAGFVGLVAAMAASKCKRCRVAQ
jgi:hypothetical protein